MSETSRVRPPVRLLAVPWDSGHRDARMGAGPTELVRAGAEHRLRSLGRAVAVQEVLPAGEWRAELATAFQLQRLVADAVAAARTDGEVPLLLAGNCNTTIGVLAGLRPAERRVGMLWFDAHGDFNTPEEDVSGFLDGQGLAMAVGRCWRSATAQVPGFAPLREEDVVLIGARDLSPAQVAALERSELAWLRPARARRRDTVAAALGMLAERVDVLHVHVDLDVHDPSIAPANGYAAPDGLTAEQVRDVVLLAAEHLPVVAGTLASYDPAHDVEGRMRDTALALLETLAEVAVPG